MILFRSVTLSNGSSDSKIYIVKNINSILIAKRVTSSPVISIINYLQLLKL